ncbi:hypothetical protein [Jiella sonneratiae]|uniref:Uncharacterized protein n=1 Tax=Jiella sonneratiae TaxID=2816856 RepID=A0ABS3J1L0_9HYPH|nr:hypothetical protein [Jiella sonneratiae]MBO0903571.1 hypothetical protein [Jiella sonneratiae]
MFGWQNLVLGATIALTFAGSATAQQNDYGGYDIVAAPKGESFYADTRGWRVFAARARGKFAYCFAEARRSDGSAFRLGWDGQQWQLAVPVVSRPDWRGTLRIDGAGSGQGYQRGGDFISGTATGRWTIAWLGEAELDGLRQGKAAVLGVGKADYDFALSGSTAAVLKVKECVGRSGEAASAAAPEPTEATAARFGKAGSWIINEFREGGRVVACETYDSAKGNLRFEIDRDNSYIDFKDGGEMGRLGQRIPVKVGFGPRDAPTDSVVEIIEGRDGEKWARITQGRSDGPGYLDDAIPNSRQVSFSGPNIILETDLGGSNKALDAFFRCSGNIQ